MKATWPGAFRWWHEGVLLLLLVGLMVAAGMVMPNFADLKSQLFLSRHIWETAILALGMTLIIISAGIDLSVGAAMGMCAVAFGTCHAYTGSLALSCLACGVTGFLGGALNGMLVARLNVHPLIVTLATYAGFRGIAEGVSQGASYSRFGEAFALLARGSWLGIPVPAYVFAVLAVASGLVLAKTPTGRFIYAIGHNETVARFSGIRVDRIKFWLYAMSGLLAGLATLIFIARFNTAKADAGTGIELDVITAVVIGGTSIFGGRGNIIGTVLGLALIHETQLFVARYWRMDELKSVLVGALLVLSILVYRLVMPNDRE